MKCSTCWETAHFTRGDRDAKFTLEMLCPRAPLSCSSPCHTSSAWARVGCLTRLCLDAGRRGLRQGWLHGRRGQPNPPAGLHCAQTPPGID